MRTAVGALLLIASTAGGQAVGRTVSVDAVPFLTHDGARAAIEPAVWGRVSLRLVFWGDETHTTTSDRIIGKRLVTSDQLRGGSVELRTYPVTIATRARSQRVLPFLSAGLAMAQRATTGLNCVTTVDTFSHTASTTCAPIDTRTRRLSPVATAGVRLLPGRMFLDLSARAVWGGVGRIGEAAFSQWRLGGELAVGYTW